MEMYVELEIMPGQKELLPTSHARGQARGNWAGETSYEGVLVFQFTQQQALCYPKLGRILVFI